LTKPEPDWASPDSPVCTRQCPVPKLVSDRTGRSRENRWARGLKITRQSGVHRTCLVCTVHVWCAPYMSGALGGNVSALR
jgi:hypothetical protein